MPVTKPAPTPEESARTGYLFITIQNRRQILYQGECNSLSSLNHTGKFDVLPHHSQFISLIKDYIIVRDLKNRQKRINFNQGLLEVGHNQTHVFLGINASLQPTQQPANQPSSNQSTNQSKPPQPTNE